jgi:hypothetical protein
MIMAFQPNVLTCVQDAFESYTQSANWGSDQTFHIFASNGDVPPAQANPAPAATDTAGFSFTNTNTPGGGAG